MRLTSSVSARQRFGDMRFKAYAFVGFGAALVALLSAPGVAQQSAGSGPQVLEVQGGKIRVVTVASGLFHPWSIAFAGDAHTILVTEKNGRLRTIRDGVL